MALLEFSMAVAESLSKQNKSLERPVGRPPKRPSTEEVTDPRGKAAAVPTPRRDIRTMLHTSLLSMVRRTHAECVRWESFELCALSVTSICA